MLAAALVRIEKIATSIVTVSYSCTPFLTLSTAVYGQDIIITKVLGKSDCFIHGQFVRFEASLEVNLVVSSDLLLNFCLKIVTVSPTATGSFAAVQFVIFLPR